MLKNIFVYPSRCGHFTVIWLSPINGEYLITTKIVIALICNTDIVYSDVLHPPFRYIKFILRSKKKKKKIYQLNFSYNNQGWMLRLGKKRIEFRPNSNIVLCNAEDCTMQTRETGLPPFSAAS